MGIVEKIAAAGIIGCGGAGFPTHKKFSGNIEYFIVNGAECEPLLRTDRWLMKNKAEDIVKAVSALKAELNIPHAVIALKDHYKDEIKALKTAIESLSAPVEIKELESFYPAGDEQTMVYEVTGRVIPPAALPISVGAVVDNIATVFAISEAMDGKPFTHKYLTVTGDVNRPSVLRVPIGTSYKECIQLAGGTIYDEFFVVTGGPMMGRPLPMDQLESAFVTKTTSGILILPKNGYHESTYRLDMRHMLNQARFACIQCTSCSSLCPRHMLGHPLEPHRIMRKMSTGLSIKDLLKDPDIRNAQLCCECGICESYACPMKLKPRMVNQLIKKELAAEGIKYPAQSESPAVNPMREYRKAPTDKVASRLGVYKYNKYEINELTEYESKYVELPLKMHIGAPASPVVRAGDRVEAGQLIADIEQGAMGAKLHASISGKVLSTDGKIVIERD